MVIDNSKINKIKDKNNKHIFYGYTDKYGDNYLLIHDRAILKSTFEKNFLYLLEAFNATFEQRERTKSITKQEIEIINENMNNCIISCEDYTAFHMDSIIRSFDVLNLFDIKMFSNSPISISGIIHNYVFGTWLMHYSFNTSEEDIIEMELED